LLLVALVLASVLQAQKAPPGTVVDAPLGVRLDEVVQLRGRDFWGAVLATVQGQPVLAKGYGLADRNKVPLGPQSLFDLGGASQLLTAALVLRLADDRKLRLDDPVRKHLAEWPDGLAAITIEHLLQHTSGLPNDAGWGGGAAQASRTALLAIGRCKLVDVPGRAFHYSPLNPILLALLAEQVMQQRFDRALADRVLKPLGMDGAGLCNGRFDGKLVTWRSGKQGEPGVPATAFELNWAHRGARGVLASPLDVQAMLAALFGGKQYDPRELDVLLRPVQGGDTLQVARPGGPGAVLRITASAHGYRLRCVVHETSRSWLVLLSDGQSQLDGLETALLAELAVFRAASTPAADAANGKPPANEPTSEPTVAPADATRFAGTFVLPGTGGRFVVEPSGGGLRLSGIGLQAAARLSRGCWPPDDAPALERSEDRGLAVIERLVLGDATVLGEAFIDEAVATAASDRLAEWLAAEGPRVRIELVGSQRLDGALHSWFLLVGARGTRRFRAVWRDELAFASFDFDRGPAPFTVPLTVVRADCATAKAGNGTLLKLTIEGTAPHRVLVVEDDSPGAAGLVEGHEADGPRR
jgi:CubicO group peptidase (beta-lactamase class C family)